MASRLATMMEKENSRGTVQRICSDDMSLITPHDVLSDQPIITCLGSDSYNILPHAGYCTNTMVCSVNSSVAHARSGRPTMHQ